VSQEKDLETDEFVSGLMVNQPSFSKLDKNGCFSLDTFSASRELSGKSLSRLLKLSATSRFRVQIHYAFR
jgi:hypothetical protein